MHLKRVARQFRPPVRYNRRTGKWSIRRTVPVSPANPPHAVSTQPSDPQIDLFDAVGMTLSVLTFRTKYGSKRKRRKAKKRGLQYKLKFYRGLKDKDRERKFVSLTRDGGQRNDLTFSPDEIYKIAALLVDRSFEEVFAAEQKGSTRIAEIVAWINRRFNDTDPFAFDFCCAVAGYDADQLRTLFFQRLRKKHGSVFPHYHVLRNRIIDAESGDARAIQWVLSDDSSELSFHNCCVALGFDPVKSRAHVLLPVVTNDSDALYEQPGDESPDSEVHDYCSAISA